MPQPPQPPEVIRSSSNPVLKRVRKALAGREKGVIVLEGRRLIDDARGAGLDFELLLQRDGHGEPIDVPAGCEVRFVMPELLAKVSALETSPGALALARTPDVRGVEDWRLPGADALVLVVAGVADPGNLGALARSAEAAGASALVVVAGGAGPWNPKALRGSMGSLLRIPVVAARDAAAAYAALAAKGARQCVAATRGGQSPAAFDWSGPLALWVSGETGAPLDIALEAITLPMAGGVESLNVTVAGSLLLFAAGRVEDSGR